jgi:hypothetical protein
VERERNVRRESKAPASGTAVTAYRRAGSSALPAGLGLALLALLGARLLSLPSQALAARKYQAVAQFPPNYPDNHHVYVADSGRGSVYDFSSVTDKTPERWNGTTTSQGSFGEGVAVSADNSTGDVFVADSSHAVIDKFDESGTLMVPTAHPRCPTSSAQVIRAVAGDLGPEDSRRTVQIPEVVVG